MEEDRIFGSNITLPTLPGLQSDCEKEILALMKEVDNEFTRKHSDVLSELRKLRSLCREQRDEIENLRTEFISDNQSNQRHASENVAKYRSGIEKLRKENNDLKNENDLLQTKLRRKSDMELQIESLKRSLTVQQDENKLLKEKLSRLNDQYESLQNNHQQVLNSLSLLGKGHSDPKKTILNEVTEPNLIDVQIAQTTEKIISEESLYYKNFQSVMNKQISKIEKNLKTDI